MTKNLLALFAAALLMACFVSQPATGEDEDGPKYKTKDVMKHAMKGPLLKKVADGNASTEEKKELLEMLVALGKNEPAKGDAESWKKLTDALVKAGKAAVDDEKTAGEMLKKAADCKACHTAHKG